MRTLPLILLCGLFIAPPLISAKDDVDLFGAIEEAGKQSEELAKQIKKAPPDKKSDLEDKRDAQLDRIDEIADKKPDSIRIQRKAAETFLKINEPERAILRADQLVRLAPNDHKAVWLRGQTFFKLGDYHSAEKDARRALALNPDDRRAFGLLKLTEGRDGPANTPPLDPNRKPSREQAAAVAYLDFAGATKTARSRKVMKLIKKANRKIALGDFAEAADIAEKAVNLAPKDPQAHLLLAKAKLETGDAKGAEASAYMVLTLDPGNAAGHLILAQAEEALGASKEDVLALYEEAMSLEPRLKSFYQEALARYAAASQKALAKVQEAAPEDTAAPTSKKIAGRSLYNFPFLGPVEEKTAAMIGLAVSAVFLIIGFIFLRRPEKR